MTNDEIRQKLTPIFRDVFDDDSLEISEATTAGSVPTWDSLTHIDMIVAVEKAFSVSFTTKEVGSLGNVGDLIRLIASRAK